MHMNENRVTHFEIPCDDPESTMKLFGAVFNWTFQKRNNF
jgi:predicted enzyme related to lactoylglutathione lyase